MMTEVGKMFAEYDIHSFYDVGSPQELGLRANILNSNEFMVSKLFKKNFTQEEQLYVIYTIISGFELCANTNEIDWMKYREEFDDEFYSEYIALTDGQSKLLFKNMKDVLNCYQLAYLDYVLTNENWQLEEHQRYFYQGWQPSYEGIREDDISDIMYQFFENPEVKYDENDMNEYFNLALRKLYSYNRLNVARQSKDINQLIQLLGCLILECTTETRFRTFLTVLDESQIVMIGI